MIRILHLADVHLGATFSAFGDIADSRRQEVVQAFRGLPEAAQAEEVDAVVITGDLFDGPRPAPELIAAVRDTSRRFRDAGAPVFLVPGNHDSITLRPSLYRDLAEYVFTAPGFGDPVSVETSGGPLHVYGIAYDPARVENPLTTYRRADRKGAHVVLLHGSVPDAPHWAMSPNALRLPIEELVQIEADYIALGDYHRFRPPAGFDTSGRAPACYAGSFAALDLTETGPRGYVIADLVANQAPVVRHRPSDVATVEDLGDFDVGTYEGEVEVVDALVERVPAETIPLVRLTGTTTFPLDADVVCVELMERYGHAQVTDDSSYYTSERIEELARQDTVVGRVVRLGRQRGEQAEDNTQRQVADRALRLVLRALEVQ